MTLRLIGENYVPAYLADVSDIGIDDKIPGASLIGKTIFMNDGTWRIINYDLTVSEYVLPVSLTISELEIGKVVLKDDTTSSTATVGANGLHVDVQSMPAVTISGVSTEAKQLPDGHNVAVSNMIPAVETGLATSAKQLPDGHNVAVSNMIPAVETGLATSANQTNGTQQVRVLDLNGLGIGSSQDSDGNNHLSVSLIQDVNADPNNSSDTNLTSVNSYTFTGTASSTLGVNGLQWSLKTTQNAKVYIDQSPDGTNWDISYMYQYIASLGGAGGTVQATQAYWRIRVILDVEIDTTEFRLQGVLCPIALPLPSSLSQDDRLRTETTITGKENIDRHVFISPLNTMTTNTTVRLVGAGFNGSVKDTNFWTETVANGGTVVQGGGEIKLSTNTTANGTAKYESVHRARFLVSRPLKFFGFFALETDPVADNIRRIGAYDTNDGFFFQIDGTVFSLVTRRATTDTPIANGTFNGNYGATWNPMADETYYRLEIEYGAFGVNFYVDGKLLHWLGIEHWVSNYTLPITMENINSGGNTTNSVMDCLGFAILGQGEYLTSPIYKYIGTNATTILKQNAGILHTITVTDNAGTLLVYDGLSAAGTLIASLDASKTTGTMQFAAPFSIGLTVVSAGTPKMTVIYE